MLYLLYLLLGLGLGLGNPILPTMQGPPKHLFVWNPNLWYILLAIWILYVVWSRRKLYYISWQLPGPISLPIIGNLFIVMQFGITNTTAMVKSVLTMYSGETRLVRMWLGPELFILVGDARVAHQVSTLTLTKADVYQHLAPPYMRKGIFVDRDIPHWKSSRKLVAQLFSFNMLKTFIPIFHDESLVLVEKLREYANSGTSFHPPELLAVATLSSILRTMLGTNTTEASKDVQPLIDAVHNLFQHFQRKVFYPFLRSTFVYSLLGYRTDEVQSVRYWFSRDFALNEKSKPEKPSVMSRTTLGQVLLASPDISLDEANAQIFTVLGAGLDTSMVQNSMLLILLAIHPDIQEMVHEEIVQILGEDASRCPCYQDLMRLEYMDRVLKECLRMYPAAPIIARKTTEDIKVVGSDGKDLIIPEGVSIAIPLFYIQNCPQYYKSPELFDPDRWLPENISTRDPICYFPFSSGPRNCVGGKYALLQMKVFTIAVLREYKILPTEQCNTLEHVRVKMNLTMELDRRCQIKLETRNKL